MKTGNKLSDARVKIVLRYPFFAGLLCRRKIVVTDAVPTAAVSDKGVVYVNPEFSEKLTLDQNVFVLAHECMHVVFAHRLRKYGRNHEVWNVACDAVINHMLKACGVGSPIEGMVFFDWVTNDTTAEEVYDRLCKEGGVDDSNSSGGIGGDLTTETPDGNGTGNTPSDTEVKTAVQQGKMEIASAYQAERLRGAGTGSLGDIVKAILEEKIPWFELLEKYMVARCQTHLSWGRPNKRYLRTAYLPGKTRQPAMGKVVIGVDTSGSISDEEIAKFLGHLSLICEQCDPESVDVLYTTDKVVHEEHYDRGEYDFAPVHNRWNGGTDMCAVTRWAEEHCEDAEVVVIFTDGYTDTPKDACADVVWVLTTDVQFEPETPGEVIRL